MFYTYIFFFFNDTATTEIYTLSLHDALPISESRQRGRHHHRGGDQPRDRSEEHTSELQSHSFISYAVFCLKKKQRRNERHGHMFVHPPHTLSDELSRA